MNLRKFRRATPKKQILDNMTKFPNKLNCDHKRAEFNGETNLLKVEPESDVNARKRRISGETNETHTAKPLDIKTANIKGIE